MLAPELVASSATSAHAGVVSPASSGARSLAARSDGVAAALPETATESAQRHRQSRRHRHRKPLWVQERKFQQWGCCQLDPKGCGQGRSMTTRVTNRGFWNSGSGATPRGSAGFRDFSGGDGAVVAAGSGSGPKLRPQVAKIQMQGG